MKKLILVLAILAVATPVFAAPSISLVNVGSGKVDVRYTGADPCNLPRAFALVVEVNKTAIITGISNYKTGVSTSTSKGYGIYPARIAIDGNGVVTGWGNPLADPCDPLPSGSDQILPSQKLVLEFGSLYAPVGYGSPNAPATDGNLCTLDVNCNGSTGTVDIKVTGEVTYRGGGIVLENGTTATVSATLAYSCGGGWPACWGYAAQCHGDTNGNGGQINTTDLGAFRNAFGRNYGDAQYDPCADFNRDGHVNTTDLGIFRTYFGTTPPGDCTPGGTWPPF